MPTIPGGEARIRTGGEGFAGPCLTTWPLRHMKEAGKPASVLTWSGLRGSNPRPPPWQGGALPTALSPQTQGLIYGNHRARATPNFGFFGKKFSGDRDGDFRGGSRRRIEGSGLEVAGSRLQAQARGLKTTRQKRRFLCDRRETKEKRSTEWPTALNSWSGLRGSNPRPPPWQGGALPTALSPRDARTYYTRTSLHVQGLFSVNLFRCRFRKSRARNRRRRLRFSQALIAGHWAAGMSRSEGTWPAGYIFTRRTTVPSPVDFGPMVTESASSRMSLIPRPRSA